MRPLRTRIAAVVILAGAGIGFWLFSSGDLAPLLPQASAPSATPSQDPSAAASPPSTSSGADTTGQPVADAEPSQQPEGTADSVTVPLDETDAADRSEQVAGATPGQRDEQEPTELRAIEPASSGGEAEAGDPTPAASSADSQSPGSVASDQAGETAEPEAAPAPPDREEASAEEAGESARSQAGETQIAAVPDQPAPARSEDVEQPADPAETENEPAGPPPILPSFDVVRVERTGEMVVAGRGMPLSEIEVVLDGTVLERVRSDARGQWVFVPVSRLAPGNYQLSLRSETEDGLVLESENVVVIVVPEPQIVRQTPQTSEPAKKAAQAPDEQEETVAQRRQPEVAAQPETTAQSSTQSSGQSSTQSSGPPSDPATDRTQTASVPEAAVPKQETAGTGSGLPSDDPPSVVGASQDEPAADAKQVADAESVADSGTAKAAPSGHGSGGIAKPEVTEIPTLPLSEPSSGPAAVARAEEQDRARPQTQAGRAATIPARAGRRVSRRRP